MARPKREERAFDRLRKQLASQSLKTYSKDELQKFAQERGMKFSSALVDQTKEKEAKLQYETPFSHTHRADGLIAWSSRNNKLRYQLSSQRSDSSDEFESWDRDEKERGNNMPLDPSVLKKWAGGQTKESKLEDEEPEEGVAEKNALWAGELEEDAEVSPELAEELLQWLEDNEPEIHDAIMELATALVEEDPDQVMIDHALDELKHATQYLNPEYEPLTDSQKDLASEVIKKHLKNKGMPEKDSKEWKQAVAIGLSEARKESEK